MPEAEVEAYQPILPAEAEEKISRKKNETKIVLPVTKTASYQKPPLELLSEASEERSIDKKNIKNSISVLEDTFSSFGISVKVKQVSCGPAVTLMNFLRLPGSRSARS
jgi:S-DNA-T family DNA segregation ATPase FtsK/SpoIIIE